MKVKATEPKRLIVTQITIDESTGSATARIPGPQPKSALDQSTALVLQAVFAISPIKILPGFQFWYHIPGSTLLDPLFLHVSITREGREGEQTQLAEIEWPPQNECRETFVVALAHMLTYSNQVIHHFRLD